MQPSDCYVVPAAQTAGAAVATFDDPLAGRLRSWGGQSLVSE